MVESGGVSGGIPAKQSLDGAPTLNRGGVD